MAVACRVFQKEDNDNGICSANEKANQKEEEGTEENLYWDSDTPRGTTTATLTDDVESQVHAPATGPIVIGAAAQQPPTESPTKS